MKPKKIRITAFLLLALISFSIFASCGEIEYAVVSENNQSADGFVYTLYENGTAVITGGTPGSGRLVIPSAVDGYNVTAIGDYAFNANEGLYYLKIEASSVKIGSFAFSGCPYLTYADLGNTTELGQCAFYGCENLTAVSGCKSLTSIGNMAFLGCSSLCSVNLGNKLTSVGYEAFSGCSSLPGITLPSSVSFLGHSAFSYCTGLAYADVSSVKELPESCFEGCTALSEPVLSDKLTSIGPLAFRGCTSLYSVTLGKSLKEIGDNAFADCSLLSEVNFMGSNTAWLRMNSGSGNELLISQRPYTKYERPASNDSEGTLPIADRGNTSGSYSGSGFNYSLYTDGTAVITGLQSSNINLTVPSEIDGHKVVGIIEDAFQGNSEISTLNLGDTLEFIGEGAFYSCSSLRTVSGGASLKSVGYAAFDETPYLTEKTEDYVTLGPVLLRYLGSNPSVRIPAGISVIAAGAFLSDTSITSVILGSNVVTLGEQAFSFCSSLRYVSGTGIRSVGSTCFAGCDSLRSFNPGSDVCEIGTYAFADCVTLRYFRPGSKLTELKGNVFQGDMNLRTVCFPKSVTGLYSSAFVNCLSFIILYEGGEDEFRAVLHEDSEFYYSDMFTVYNCTPDD